MSCKLDMPTCSVDIFCKVDYPQLFIFNSEQINFFICFNFGIVNVGSLAFVIVFRKTESESMYAIGKRYFPPLCKQ